MHLMLTRPLSASIKRWLCSQMKLSGGSMINWVAPMRLRSERAVKVVAGVGIEALDVAMPGSLTMLNLYRQKSSLTTCFSAISHRVAICAASHSASASPSKLRRRKTLARSSDNSCRYSCFFSSLLPHLSSRAGSSRMAPTTITPCNAPMEWINSWSHSAWTKSTLWAHRPGEISAGTKTWKAN